MKRINYNKLLFFWLLLSALLAGTLVLTIYVKTGKTFAIILNTTNIILFTLALVFQKKVKASIKCIIDDFEKINETKSTQVKYNHEVFTGILLTALTVIFGVYIIVISITNVPLFSTLIWEDGPLEYSSVIFWILSAIVLLTHVFKQKKNAVNNFQCLPYSLLIIFFILSAGEEISWGQRLLNITTPNFLKSINVQGEITLHNIGSTSIFSNAFFLLTLLFFIVIPLLAKEHDNIKTYLHHYSIPIPNRFVVYIFFIILFIWLFIGIRFGTLGFHPFMLFHYKSQMDDEIFEFLASYSFFAFSIMDSLKSITIDNNSSSRD